MQHKFFTRIFTLLALAFISVSAVCQERVTYYYTDVQGTPLVTVDGATGATSSVDYRPYGAQTLGAAQDGPGYTGHVEDTASGLVYMQARYFDPQVGRFLSRDPLAVSAGQLFSVNRFAYASGNPIKNIDPDGKQDEDGEAREEETRQALEALFPKQGPNQAGPGYIAPLPPLPVAETSTDHIINQSTGLEPAQDLAKSFEETSAKNEPQTSYQIYEKIGPNGEIYTGRTKGTGTPEENVARRDSGHHMNAKGFGPAQLRYNSLKGNAIRGQEQVNINANGGAISQGGTSGNAINGISARNPNAGAYLEAARQEFGE